MVEFVAADTVEADRGNQFFNIGVLLEISSGSEFDEHYFSTMDDICEAHNIRTQFKVLKSNDIKKQTPSYDIPSAREDYVAGILSNPAVEMIYITIGYCEESISPSWYDGTKSGPEFAKGWMQSVFEIMTLWQYSEYRFENQMPDDAWVDDISGKICPCWSYVNREFDLSVAPKGDRTYPSLASADMLAGYLRDTLPMDKELDELADASYGTLISKAEDEGIGDVDIQVEDINAEYKDDIVPHYPYPISTGLHYPSPMLFVYCDDFESSPGKVLPRTDFFASARKWAYENRGCLKFIQDHEFSDNVSSGDAIAYTTADPPRVCKSLVRLNQSREIDLLSSNDLADSVELDSTR